MENENAELSCPSVLVSKPLSHSVRQLGPEDPSWGQQLKLRMTFFIKSGPIWLILKSQQMYRYF